MQQDLLGGPPFTVIYKSASPTTAVKKPLVRIFAASKQWHLQHTASQPASQPSQREALPPPKMPDLFALPVFFITFREALETAIIVSVLLAFLKQTLADRPASDDDDSGAQQQQRRHLYRKMVRQVWLGTASGLLVCVVLGGLLITVFHEVELPDGAEDVWEGVFSLIASVIITLVGAVLLRVSKLQDKWTAKLAAAMSAKDRPAVARGTGGAWAQMRSRMAYASEKYALFVLPFVTVLREGFEGVVFIAGVGMAFPPSSIPLAALAGLVAGSALGFLIYEYGLSSDFLCQTCGCVCGG